MATTKLDKATEEARRRAIVNKKEKAKAKLINDNKLPKDLLGKEVRGINIIKREKHEAI